MGSRVLGEEQRRALGRALRAARDAAGRTQSRVAKVLNCSQGRIQKIESGTAPISAAELNTLIEYLHIPDPRAAELRRLATPDRRYLRSAARPPGWSTFGQLSDLENDALEIRCLHGDCIPGVLQSEPYMLQVMIEVFGGDVDIADLIKQRRGRAQILAQENGPRYRVILSESAVRRTLRGKPDILIDQLEHLLTLIRRRERLELQILLFEADRLFMDSDFRILRFADGRRDFAYVESAGSAHRFKAKRDLEQFDVHWERLRSAALSRTESEDYLARLVNSKTRRPEGNPEDTEHD